MRQRWDAIVVGAGICGLATAYQLTRRGASTLVVERTAPGAEQSAGLGRIFRIAHRRAYLCALALEAADGWRRWEADLGAGRLLGSEGVVIAVPGAAEEHGAAMHAAGADWEALDRDAISARVPLLAPGHPWVGGVLDPLGGSLRIRRALDALAARVEVRAGEAVAVTAGDNRAAVTLDGGEELRAGAVVVCAGLRTPALAATAGIPIELGPIHHHVRLTYDMRAPAEASACLIVPDGYGLPLGSTGRWAFGLDDPALVWPLEEFDAADVALAVRRHQADWMPQRFAGLLPEPVGEVRCVSLHAPWLPDDGDGFLARRRGAVVAFVGSNLMKFGPVVGDRLARMVLEGDDTAWWEG